MYALSIIFGFLALVFGAIAAVFGGVWAVIFFAPIFPILFVVRDYRVGVVLLMFLTAFQSTPFLPHFSGFNIVNYLTAGTLGSLLLAIGFRRIHVAPFPRFILWTYLIPVTVAAIEGAPHLDEMTPYLVHVMSGGYKNTFEYFGNFLIKPLFLLLLSWMLGTAMLNSHRKERFLLVFVAASWLPALAVLVFVARSGFSLTILSSPQGRSILLALGMFSNSLGVLMSSALAVMLFMLPQVKGWARAGIAISLGVVGAAIILTFSRGSYLMVAVAVAYFMIRNRQIKTSLLILVLAAIVVLPFGHAVWRRVTRGVVSNATRTSVSSEAQLTSGRIYIWGRVLPEILRHPLIGSGIGSTAWSDAALSGEIRVNNPQNLYLAMLADTGIIGTALILVFYWRVLGIYKRLADNSSISPLFAAAFRGAWIGFIGFMLSGMAYNSYMTTPTQTYIWLMFGMALAFLKETSVVHDQPGVQPEVKTRLSTMHAWVR